MSGIPFGKITLKKTNLFFSNPKVITLNQINKAHGNVIVKWLVIENANGNIPIKFEDNINKNINKRNEK